jgi:hypothetical protein
MKIYGRPRAGILLAVGMGASPPAFASGHQPGGPLVLVALLWKLWPFLIALIVCVRTFFGRPSILKLVGGIVSTFVASIGVLVIIGDDSPWYLPAAALGLLVIAAHCVRFGTHALHRATGLSTKETAKRWRRYL